MKAVFYICMTSGIQGPELDLTEEQLKPIVELAGRLTQPWDGSKLAGLGLGPDHYGVFWQDGDGYYGIRTESSGFVDRWMPGDTEWVKLKDTIGLWSHLAQYGGPAHQKWIDDMAEQYKNPQEFDLWSIFKNSDT